MDRIFRTAVPATIVAVLCYGFLPGWAAAEAAITGFVEVPCDPSRLGDVASIEIRSLADGSAVKVPVDPTTGAFRSPGLDEGEYELVALGADGQPLSPQVKRLEIATGLNSVVLSLEPPGCGEKQGKKRGKRDRLEDWHVTLLYVGVVGTLALALANDREDRASPSEP